MGVEFPSMDSEPEREVDGYIVWLGVPLEPIREISHFLPACAFSREQARKYVREAHPGVSVMMGKVTFLGWTNSSAAPPGGISIRLGESTGSIHFLFGESPEVVPLIG